MGKINRFKNKEEYNKAFYEIFSDKEYKVMSDFIAGKYSIDILHIPCNTLFTVNAGRAIRDKKISCPKCSKHYTKIIPYVNDIFTTNPEVYELLTDKEDGHKYKAHSSKKVSFTCPFCHRIHEQIIDHVTRRGFSCPFCGDHCGSFAEKYMANMLKQLGIKFKKEYSPEWLKPYRFDFQFDYIDNRYIIEIDGGWHFADNNYSNTTLEEQQKIDEYKQKLAESKGFKVFRIDNNYKNSNKSDYIYNSIINSPLNEIFDLSNVDFYECNYYASHSSIIIEVSNVWQNGIRSVQQLSDMFGKNITSIRDYLKMACESGVLCYTYEEVKKLNKEYYINVTRRMPQYDDDVIKLWMRGIHNFPTIAKMLNIKKETVRLAFIRATENNVIPFSYDEIIKINKRDTPHSGRSGQKVLCNETGEIFNNYSEADKKYRAKLSCYFSQENRKFSGTLPDGTRLTWTKIEDKKVAQ